MTATQRSTLLRTLLLSALVVWPVLPHVPYDFLNTAILACDYCVVALSLVLLIGIVGQISLCQAALVGMGAFVSALATNKAHVHFPFTLVVGTVAGALTAALIGVVALRVRGLYLAVATLIFGYLCDQYLFGQTWLVQNASGTSIPFENIGKPGTIPSFDLSDAHIFYYVALGIAALSLYSVANLRESRIGRAFAAVRGSEVAAASLGINVVRIKLLGFACAGALAGLGGALTLVGQPDRGTGPVQLRQVAGFPRHRRRRRAPESRWGCGLLAAVRATRWGAVLPLANARRLSGRHLRRITHLSSAVLPRRLGRPS